MSNPEPIAAPRAQPFEALPVVQTDAFDFGPPLIEHDLQTSKRVAYYSPPVRRTDTGSRAHHLAEASSDAGGRVTLWLGDLLPPGVAHERHHLDSAG